MMTPARVTDVVSDVRALGWGAPVRAAYEASKRWGGHAVVFKAMARRRLPALEVRSPFSAVPRDSIPEAARQRCLQDVSEICAGRLRIFGTTLHGHALPDWHAALDGPGRWPLRPWWTIDLRSAARTGDVKWTWELSRHRHLVVLARAARLQPEEPRWRCILSEQLTSWLDANPAEMGVHWYSNLEISLRAIAWLWVLALAGEELDGALRRRMSAALYHSGRHLLADLAYTLSSMRNNHLLGDALGLAALGRSFPDDARARRWAVLGDRLFRRQLRRHVHADGSMVEDSVSYHRFVVEMLSVRLMLGGDVDEECAVLRRAAGFLCRLGVLDDDVPVYGDWDEGRVLASSTAALDVSGSTRLALSLLGTGGTETWRAAHDEVAWYVGEGVPSAADDAECCGHPLGGGLTRISRGSFTCWLKAGSAPSHCHADLCSTVVRHGGVWVIGDPGTGSYNGSPEERDHFRSSAAHSVLRLDGQDQLVPHRAFRWRFSAEGSVGAPAVMGGVAVAWGFHNAYRRLEPPRRIARAVMVSDGGVVVADWVEEGEGLRFALTLPLDPGARWEDGHVVTAQGARLALTVCGDVTVVRGGLLGSWSPTYGSVVPSTALVVEGTIDGPVVWEVRSGGDPGFRVDRETVEHVSGMRLGLDWSTPAPRLRVSPAA